MKNFYIIIFINIFFVLPVFSMQHDNFQGTITSKIFNAYILRCNSKLGSNLTKKLQDLNNCGCVFESEKFLMELKEDNNKQKIDSTIFFKTKKWGELLNNIELDKNSLRYFVLANMAHAIKSGDKGVVKLDNFTTCQIQNFSGNRDRGSIKCETLLNKKN